MELKEIDKHLLTAEKIDMFINKMKAKDKESPLTGKDYIKLSDELGIPLELMLLQAAQESNFGTKGAATRTHNIFNIMNVTAGDTLTPEEAKAKGYRKDYGDWVNGVKAYAKTIKKYIPKDGNWLTLLNKDSFRRKDYNARYAADKTYEESLTKHKITLEKIVNS